MFFYHSDIQISEGEFYLKDLSTNTIECLPLQDILKPVPTDKLIPRVYQLDTLQPLCISKDVVAHVQKDLKRFGPTFTLKCSGYSTGQKQDLILFKPRKELCKIEPVVSLQFFPKESWYCVAFSHCNLTMEIFLVKLDVPELTLTRFSFSSFTQKQLDPTSMFVNHVEKQKPIEGIPDMGEPTYERNKSVPKESSARFWMSRGRLFCMMSPRPGYIRLLGCNTKDFKFNILSQGGQSQRLGAYPLRLDQTLVPGYNGGTYLSLFTVRGNPLRTNRPEHYEIRRLRIKF